MPDYDLTRNAPWIPAGTYDEQSLILMADRLGLKLDVMQEIIADILKRRKGHPASEQSSSSTTKSDDMNNATEATNEEGEASRKGIDRSNKDEEDSQASAKQDGDSKGKDGKHLFQENYRQSPEGTVASAMGEKRSAEEALENTPQKKQRLHYDDHINNDAKKVETVTIGAKPEAPSNAMLTSTIPPKKDGLSEENVDKVVVGSSAGVLPGKNSMQEDEASHREHEPPSLEANQLTENITDVGDEDGSDESEEVDSGEGNVNGEDDESDEQVASGFGENDEDEEVTNSLEKKQELSIEDEPEVQNSLKSSKKVKTKVPDSNDESENDDLVSGMEDVGTPTPEGKPKKKVPAKPAHTPVSESTSKLNTKSKGTPMVESSKRIASTEAATPEGKPKKKAPATPAHTPVSESTSKPSSKLNTKSKGTPMVESSKKIASTEAATPEGKPKNKELPTPAHTPVSGSTSKPSSKLNTNSEGTPRVKGSKKMVSRPSDIIDLTNPDHSKAEPKTADEKLLEDMLKRYSTSNRDLLYKSMVALKYEMSSDSPRYGLHIGMLHRIRMVFKFLALTEDAKPAKMSAEDTGEQLGNLYLATDSSSESKNFLGPIEKLYSAHVLFEYIEWCKTNRVTGDKWGYSWLVERKLPEGTPAQKKSLRNKLYDKKRMGDGIDILIKKYGMPIIAILPLDIYWGRTALKQWPSDFSSALLEVMSKSSIKGAILELTSLVKGTFTRVMKGEMKASEASTKLEIDVKEKLSVTARLWWGIDWDNFKRRRFVSENGLWLSGGAILGLQPGEWLSDQIIDAILSLHLFPKEVTVWRHWEKGGWKHKPKITRQTERVLIPCHLPGHWILMVVEFGILGDYSVYYMNSLGTYGDGLITSIMPDVNKAMEDGLTNVGRPFREKGTIQAKESLQQQNGDDCGVITLMNALVYCDKKYAQDVKNLKGPEILAVCNSERIRFATLIIGRTMEE